MEFAIDAMGLNLEALASASGTEVAFLQNVIDRLVHPYSRVSIEKRTGGIRNLDVPRDELLLTQRWVLANVLGTARPNSNSFAYLKGSSATACAEKHLGARWVLHMDLKSFFTSIDERSLYYLFLKEFSLSRLFAFQLARLLTREPLESDDFVPQKYREPYVSVYRHRYKGWYDSHRLGYLPQGSPTSGAIANLVARPLDMRLKATADLGGFTYTRYADDLFFSSYRIPSREEVAPLLRKIADDTRLSGFEINVRKTRVSGPGAALTVLGLHVDGQSLRLRRTTKERIDRHLWAIGQFGIEAHSLHSGFDHPADLLSHLRGLLSYANDVSKGWTRSRRDAFSRILDDTHYSFE